MALSPCTPETLATICLPQVERKTKRCLERSPSDDYLFVASATDFVIRVDPVRCIIYAVSPLRNRMLSRLLCGTICNDTAITNRLTIHVPQGQGCIVRLFGNGDDCYDDQYPVDRILKRKETSECNLTSSA